MLKILENCYNRCTRRFLFIIFRWIFENTFPIWVLLLIIVFYEFYFESNSRVIFYRRNLNPLSNFFNILNHIYHVLMEKCKSKTYERSIKRNPLKIFILSRDRQTILGLRPHGTYYTPLWSSDHPQFIFKKKKKHF